MEIEREGIPPFIWALSLAAGLVVAFNLFLVWKASHVHEDMVLRDYYRAGLGYDSVVTAQRRVDSLGLDIGLIIGNGMAEVFWGKGKLPWHEGMPTVGVGAPWRCEAHFYRPDSEKLDFSLALTEDSLKTGLWKAHAPPLKSGFWKVTVQWYLGKGLWLEKRFLYQA